MFYSIYGQYTTKLILDRSSGNLAVRASRTSDRPSIRKAALGMAIFIMRAPAPLDAALAYYVGSLKGLLLPDPLLRRTPLADSCLTSSTLLDTRLLGATGKYLNTSHDCFADERLSVPSDALVMRYEKADGKQSRTMRVGKVGMMYAPFRCLSASY